MENNANRVEVLIERVVEYSKSSYELLMLKTLDKTSDAVSSIIPHLILLVLIASFLFFLNLGAAFWLGEILGKIFYGFFAVAAFYIILGLVFSLFFSKRIKRVIENYIIKSASK